MSNPGRCEYGPSCRHVNQPRVVAFEDGPIQLQVLHRSRAQILHQDVGSSYQTAKYLLARGLFEIQCQRALVSVEADEGGGLTLDEGTAGARLVTADRVFHLDDVSAQIRELKSAKGGGHEVAYFDDPNSAERT